MPSKYLSGRFEPPKRRRLVTEVLHTQPELIYTTGIYTTGVQPTSGSTQPTQQPLEAGLIWTGCVDGSRTAKHLEACLEDRSVISSILFSLVWLRKEYSVQSPGPLFLVPHELMASIIATHLLFVL